MDYTRLFGAAMPPDNAGTIGENGVWPSPAKVTNQQVMNGLNPLHYVPVVGMIYRAATGEQIPTTMRVAGAGLIGGPLGMIGAAFMSLLEELIRMGPDTSRPATPAGMSVTGSEAGVQPVTPGMLTGTQYVSLATQLPEFLQSQPDTALAQRGASAYQSAAQSAAMEYQRSQSWEKGMA